MPRTLPWLVGGGNDERIKKEPGSHRKRIKSEAPSDNDSKAKTKSATPDTPNRRDFLRSSRSPSSSPIRKPPPEEYLIEGFDNDDMYIMVEDEFYAVAQSFTQHLHHAEYVRRKKEAKMQNAAVIKDLAHPTDGKTAMREETKRRKESEALHARQRSGLDETRGKRPRVDSKEEEDSELDEDKEDDPWVGTSLHGLMTSPRKARSLVGLQGIKSTTRAAAGYSQTSGSDSRGRDHIRSSPPPVPQKEPEVHTVDETASEEDDDLEIQPSKVTTVSRTLPQTKTPIKSEPSSSPVKRKIHSRAESSRPSPHLEANKINPTHSKYSFPSGSNLNAKMKMLFDELDGSPERSHNSDQDRTRDSDSASATSQRDTQSDNAKSKKSYLNEVPTFLL
ncbi:hypothetical protein VTN00DRAFT_3869 [Thermoascus crustaceus]|uniref:uncharacterized protein n=1 Tax=Thermoascus crustaceus TaxID=5088 RepID=UPI0037443774